VIEELYNSNRQDVTRVRRAFGWVVTFREFPVGSYQIIGGDGMMSEAITLFTKGRAEFWLDGERRGDRVPGILSTEHEPVGLDGTFRVNYIERTSRLCIPAVFNNGKLPTVQKMTIGSGERIQFSTGQYLVCLGAISFGEKIFNEEQTFQIVDGPKEGIATADSILLEFKRK
jgi:hypothetical protein